MNFFGLQLNEKDSRAQSPLQAMQEVFELIKPKPSSHPLIRIGGDSDGSYLVPDDLVGIVACFSPGVNNFKNFEDFLVDRYGIECHMCDYSSDLEKLKSPLKEGKQTFAKKWLDVRTEGDSISLDDWTRERAPNGDLILQMDIEGAEYRNILAVSEEVLARFRIIVLEVHHLGYIKNAAALHTVIRPFFEKLSKFHSLIHVHPNNCCGDFVLPGVGVRVPKVMELTYVRKDRSSSTQYPPLLPHPLDVSRNVRHKPPLFLGEEWLDGGRALESRVKMLEDRFESEFSQIEDNSLLLRSLATMTRRAASTRATACREVAAGKPYVLSSGSASRPTTGVVHRADKYFFHTNIGKNQFIKIDLGAAATLCKIEITNRTDGCFNRARSLFAILRDDRGDAGEDVFHIPTPDDFLSGKARECAVDIPPTRARFVVLTSSVETALHFSDVKIFAVDPRASLPSSIARAIRFRLR